MKTFISILLFSTCYIPAFTQNIIQGRIVNESGNPLPNANVFIHNSQKGTVSNAKGEFILTNIPKGQHELIISSIGYETNVFPFFEEQLPLKLKVEMAIKARELENVTVTSERYEEGNWSKYGAMFTAGFIGSMPNAEKCRIKNKEILQFRYYPHSQRLKAFSDEPLIIENNALGYIINYQLENFEINQVTGSTSYRGYSMFIEMEKKNKNEEKKWSLNRTASYHGSLMHFMRSVYRNTLVEEGFDVRRMIRTNNKEKSRVKAITGNNIRYKSLPDGTTIAEIKNKQGLSYDSVTYFQRVLLAPDSMWVHDFNLLTADSITTVTPDSYPALRFNDQLSVSFRKNKTSISYLSLAPGASVSVDEQGYFSDSRDLFVSGYWGFTERAANFLPQDFEPADIIPDEFVSRDHSKNNNPLKKNILTQHSVVKDSSGTIYPFVIWQPMIASGNYMLTVIDSTDPNSHFMLQTVADKSKVSQLLSQMKPPESNYFRTGAKFSPLKLTDIHGNSIDTKGKLLVLNYWFINCPPCKLEIPKLNELVFQYKNNKDIVFVAIALDAAPALLTDQVKFPFKYQVVANGRRWADQYSIRSYPTHVVVNKEGRIVFHCTGYMNSIGYWLEKYIEENK